MLTRDRAEAIAQALDGFTGWAPVSADDLVRLVALELGHPEALDGFQPWGPGAALAAARPVSPLLHVMSGNTPAAAVQSLSRGLLLGCHNLAKLARGAPACDDAVRAFLGALPPPLRERVELSHELDDGWLQRAGGVIVFGGDEAVRAVRARLRPDQVFQAHGHAVTVGLVLGVDPGTASASVAGAAADIVAYEQHGCLSPHDIYVAGGPATARKYAGSLAAALAEADRLNPPPAPDTAGAATVLNLRSSYRFRAASDPRVALWYGEAPGSHTVIFEEDAQFAASPGFRTVFVKPLPDDPATALRLVLDHLSTVALDPFEEPFISTALALGAGRVCRFGDAQRPPITWHQDGLPTLSPFVRWTDLG